MNYDYSYSGSSLPNTVLDESGLAAFTTGFTLLYCCILIAIVFYTGFIYCMLAKKMGFHPLLGIVALIVTFIPLLNIILPLVVVLMKWPIEEEVEKLRGHKKSAE